jgi:hypothetical protein
VSDETNDPARTPGAGDDPEPEEARARFTGSAGAAKWGATSDTYKQMNGMLAIAVPVWIMRYLARGGPEPADFKRVAGYNGELGRADVLLFGGKHRPGEIAAFFNHMAEAMAVLSFCPSGIELFDLRYESLPLLAAMQERVGQEKADSSEEQEGAP